MPTVYFFKERDKLILKTDISAEHWKVILKVEKRKDELAYRYNYGKFKPNEINYITYEKERLATKNGIKNFYIYLTPKKFTIKTNNQIVKDFLKKKSKKGEKKSKKD